MVTAKVQCQSKIESGEDENRQVQVTFVADYADGRNKEWSLYTPALSLYMTLKGAVADEFQVGDKYTLTFEKEAKDGNSSA